MVFGWNRAVIVYKFSIVLGCSFSIPMVREDSLLWGLLLFVSIGTSRLLLSSAECLKTVSVAKRKPSISPVYFLRSQGPDHPAFYSPPFRVSLCLFGIMSRVFSCVGGKKREKHVYSISLLACL